LRACVQNPSFLFLFGIFGFALGAFNAYITLLSQYITPKGYSEVCSSPKLLPNLQ
jgi:hypothetical protein